ncbi:MAG: carbamoyltransferase [bacterium]|nr:carbamoyltransferase [bacterium]
MNILGISCYYHDAAAALLCDGELIAAAEEERFSRKKHDFGFPALAIDFCLSEGGISAQDLDYVVFYEKPFEKFERILTTALQTYPKSWKVFRESMITWLVDKLWVRHHIQQELGVPKDKVLFTQHHLAHAASAFLVSPFEEAAVLTVDGVGEWATATYGVGKGTDLRLFKEIRFPHSLGLLYSAFTAFLGFEVNEGEYKVMGMAPYGEPKYVDKVWKVIQQYEDGSFSLDMDYFCFHHSTSRTYNRKFEDLFGEPRPPEIDFFTDSTGYPDYFGDKPDNYDELCRMNQHYADIAASIQRVTEDVLVKMAQCIRAETGLDALCIAGGVGLNSVANTRILKESGFQRIYIQPAAGDGGGALGAALHVYHTMLGQPRKLVMKHAYWGKAYGDDEVESFLKREGIAHKKALNERDLLDQTVGALTSGKVIGWYQGRFEWGPRALGNRSILADPRRAEMKDVVNTKIKFREPYRPFAPSVLAERAEEFFELPDATEHDAARFMLLVTPVRPEKHDVIPAITHVDGTGRLQTVFEETNPLYYRLIRSFGEATGVPVLLNTSFNLRGEPVVTTPENAYSTFKRSEMDLLVMGNYLVSK